MDLVTFDLQGQYHLYGLPSYLNPFIDYSTLFQPTNWHNALRWCHHPHTYIETKDNWFKPIADVKVGDLVWTHSGWREVTNAFVRDYSGLMVSIRPFGLLPITVTPDHALYIRRKGSEYAEIVPAVDIRIGDYVLCPYQTIENLSKLLDSSKEFKDVNEILYDLLDTIDHNEQGFGISLSNEKIDNLFSELERIYKIHRLLESCRVVSHFNGHDLACQFQIQDKDLINFNDLGCWRRVNEIVAEEYTGPVYSLTVEGTHNYVANGVLSRNCEYIASTNDILSSAIERVISFFITDIEIRNVPMTDKENIYNFLTNEMHILRELSAIALDFIIYGNIFVSVNVPFVRTLKCTNCKGIFRMDRAPLTYTYVYNKNDDSFRGTCILCKKDGVFKYKDLKLKDKNAYRIKRWSIYEMSLDYDEFSGNFEILWEPSPNYKERVKSGHLISVANAPKSVLDVVHEGQKLHIHKDKIFFGKDRAPSGLKLNGWGLSRVFKLIRAAWNYQLLNRSNEAVALDFIVPLRVVVPQTRMGGEGGDPISEISLRRFKFEIARMLHARRRDPTRWLISSYPLDYRTVGGDGRLFAPVELMERAMDRLLNSAQVPAEFYRGTMTMNAAPIGLRIMTSLWGDLVKVLNSVLSWIKQQYVIHLEWDPDIQISLAPPTHVDDINRQMLKTQLMMSGVLAQGSVLKALGEDLKENIRQKTEEQMLMADEAERAKKLFEGKEMAQQMAQGQGMMGGMPPGMGMPDMGGAMVGGGGGGTAGPAGPGAIAPEAAGMMFQDPVQQILATIPPLGQQKIDPQELDAQAAQIAQAVWSMPETAKDSLLRQLKIKNETYWMAVKEKLNDMYSAARRQGVIMSKQQG